MWKIIGKKRGKHLIFRGSWALAVSLFPETYRPTVAPALHEEKRVDSTITYFFFSISSSSSSFKNLILKNWLTNIPSHRKNQSVCGSVVGFIHESAWIKRDCSSAIGSFVMVKRHWSLVCFSSFLNEYSTPCWLLDWITTVARILMIFLYSNKVPHCYSFFVLL